jgi:hypothetical protein
MNHKHLLWTININGYLSDNARESLSHAADRWGCDFLEIRTIFNEELYPSFAKVTSFSKIESYERAMFVDSDMLINIDTPNPFEIFSNRDKFVAVLDFHKENHVVGDKYWEEVKVRNQEFHWNVLESHFGWGVSKEEFLDNFFNSGFFICTPKRHKVIFRALESALPLVPERMNFRYSAHYEQALFNYVVHAFRKKDLLLVEEKWNKLEPDITLSKMPEYIWHFTGVEFHKIKHTIKDYDWRAK